MPITNKKLYQKVLFLCIVILFIPALAGNNLLLDGDYHASQLSPSPFLHFTGNSIVFLVEKKSQQFFILQVNDTAFSVIKQYSCSTGKVSGNKNEAGDLKTPEGIYFIIEEKDSSRLSLIYGAGAFVLDYPNAFDQLNKKNGHGIWIHGTNEPERIKNSNDTQGCVVLNNEDYKDLGQFVKPHITPVLIVNELLYRQKQFINQDKNNIMSFLDNWQRNWQDRNIEGYMQCYAANFTLNFMNWQEYHDYKNYIFNTTQSIDVEFSNLQIICEMEQYVVNFYQTYKADGYIDYGIKQLYLQKDNDQYHIIKEVWTRLN
ncbi:MAG TPA: L,D-transpeptidase family protein [bacterium]|nr:L,D-transpeptidase family protein [bacterium]HPN42670.1 L,D-transpeptidase family protein [bacterium]